MTGKSSKKHHHKEAARPTAPATPPRPLGNRSVAMFSSDASFSKDGITVLLQDTAIWNEFNRIGNEMIVTKPGRRMFPSLNVTVRGLVDAIPYNVSIRTKPFDKNRYKYLDNRWIAVGPSEVDQKEDRQLYQHPSGLNNGKFWMKKVINFQPCKITHNSHGKHDSNILVHTMHKYQLEVEIENTSDKTITTISLPLTQFIAVTAYQNTALTQLKIDKNPFAKGFRNENTVKLEQQQLNPDPPRLIPAPPQAAVNCSLCPTTVPCVRPRPQLLPCVQPQAGAIDESTPGHFVAPRPRTVPPLGNPRLELVRTGYSAPPLPPPVKRRRIIMNGFVAPSPLATSQQCAATFDSPALEQWAPRNRPSAQPVKKFSRAPPPLMIAKPEYPLPDEPSVTFRELHDPTTLISLGLPSEDDFPLLPPVSNPADDFQPNSLVLNPPVELAPAPGFYEPSAFDPAMELALEFVQSTPSALDPATELASLSRVPTTLALNLAMELALEFEPTTSAPEFLQPTTSAPAMELPPEFLQPTTSAATMELTPMSHQPACPFLDGGQGGTPPLVGSDMVGYVTGAFE